MEVKTDVNELLSIIENRQYDKARIVTVEVNAIIISLEETLDEVESIHTKTVNVWKKAVRTYTKFITANPGSTQMSRPGAMPKKPKIVEDVKGYLRMFNSMTEANIQLELSYLERIFMVSSTARFEAGNLYADYVSFASGSVVTLNSLSNTR